MIALAIEKMLIGKRDDMSSKCKFGMLSSSIRKKNKITEKNISSIDNEKFEILVAETLKEYLIFES